MKFKMQEMKFKMQEQQFYHIALSFFQRKSSRIIPWSKQYSQTELNCEKGSYRELKGVIGRYSALHKLNYWPLTPNGAKRNDKLPITPKNRNIRRIFLFDYKISKDGLCSF